MFNLAAMAAWLITWTALSPSGPALAADAHGFVTASSIHSDPYLAEYALDGDPQTRWASRGFAGKPERLRVDLGKVLAIESLAVHWERAHAVAYQIQVSADGRDWQTVHERQDGKGGREVITGLSAQGRYLRVLCLEPGQFGTMSRHIVFNLTRPGQSLLLLVPLAEPSGGLALCRDAEGNPASVFADTEDPDYQKLLAMATAGKDNLDAIKRFDMPGFRPRPQYLREMKRYGVLPLDTGDDAPVDPYELDRRYWESLWYRGVQ